MNANNLVVYNVDNSEKVLNIEGAMEKYCINRHGQIYYIKFNKNRKTGEHTSSCESFFEVLSSQIARNAGVNCVEYKFLKEIDRNFVRTGSISCDYARDVLYRASLQTLLIESGELTKREVLEDGGVFCDVNTAFKAIMTFRKTRGYVNNSEQKSKMILTNLENQVISDYFLFNSDHHTKNTEILCMQGQDGITELIVAPLFDLGKTFRGQNSQMAFSFPHIDENCSGSLQDIYARDILAYYAETYSSTEKLITCQSFHSICNFLKTDIRKEVISTLFRASGNSFYDNYELDSQSYDEMIVAGVNDFNQETNSELNINEVMDAISSFEDRQKSFTSVMQKSSNQAMHNAYQELIACSVEQNK